MPGPDDDLEDGIDDAGGTDGGEGGTDDGAAEPTLDETLAATFREIEERDEAGADGADPLAGQVAKAQQRRDQRTQQFRPGTQQQPPKGAKGGPPGKQAPAAGQQPPAGQQAAPGQPGAPQGKPHDTLPATWNRGLAEVWPTLPENARQEIYKREDDVRKGISQYRGNAEAFTAMAGELIQPFMQDFQAVGMRPREALHSVVKTWSDLVRGNAPQRAAIIRQLADNFGITSADLGAPRDGGNSQQSQGHSPELATALQRIDQLEGTLRGFQEQRNGDIQREQEAELGQLQTEWAQFRADPKNKHADKLAPRMQALLNSGQAESYEGAYEQACWLDAEVREAIAAEKAVAQGNDEAARAAAARKAGGVNVVRRGLPAPPRGGSKVEDTLRETFREIQARMG